MMKEKNWLTWLTVLALVVGFAAMGASWPASSTRPAGPRARKLPASKSAWTNWRATIPV